MYIILTFATFLALIYTFCMFTQHFGDWMRAALKAERLSERAKIKEDLYTINNQQDYSDYRRKL